MARVLQTRKQRGAGSLLFGIFLALVFFFTWKTSGSLELLSKYSINLSSASHSTRMQSSRKSSISSSALYYPIGNADQTIISIAESNVAVTTSPYIGSKAVEESSVHRGPPEIILRPGPWLAADDSWSCAAPLTREAADAAARDGLLMLTVANANQLHFFRNWLATIRDLGIDYVIVASVDEETQRELEIQRVPCFRHAIVGAVNNDQLTWGMDGWRVMTWQHVFIVKELLGWGFTVVASDLDVVWLKNPAELASQHPSAELLMGHDGVWNDNENPQADDLEKDASVHHNLNTGVYVVRSTNASRGFFSAWAAHFVDENGHDQTGMYHVLREDNLNKPHPDNEYVRSGWRDQLWVGVLPVYAVANSHTYTVSRLHELLNTGLPYSVHATWTYGGQPGKVSRLREAMLWRDPPEYYQNGDFLTVELQVPEMPVGYNAIMENEPQIVFHLDALQQQLEQAAVGLAVAIATKRTFIMPRFVCFCERIWHAVVRCRLPGADKMKFPTPCPADYYFFMEKFEDDVASIGPPIAVRENSFLENSHTASAIKESSPLRIVFRNDRDGLAACDALCRKDPAGCGSKTECASMGSGPDGKPALEVEAGLHEATLKAVLQTHGKANRVWRLDLSNLASPWDAFGGFACRSTAHMFDERMGRVLQEWCCRFPEDAVALNKTEKVLLHMVPPDKRFSVRTGLEAC